MFESFATEGTPVITMTAEILAVRLAWSLLLGMLVAVVYRFSHGRNKPDAKPMSATLILLPVLIAMVSVVIGNSVARAFSLVGALSIVRFRTIVEDTRDTAFVILSVIVGMAAGAGMLVVPLLGLPLVAFAAIAFEWGIDRRFVFGNVAAAEVVIRFAAGADPTNAVRAVLNSFASSTQTTSASTARQGTALEVVYRVRLRDSETAPRLVAELNRVDGVQSVECKLEK